MPLPDSAKSWSGRVGNTLREISVFGKSRRTQRNSPPSCGTGGSGSRRRRSGQRPHDAALVQSVWCQEACLQGLTTNSESRRHLAMGTGDSSKQILCVPELRGRVPFSARPLASTARPTTAGAPSSFDLGTLPAGSGRDRRQTPPVVRHCRLPE